MSTKRERDKNSVEAGLEQDICKILKFIWRSESYYQYIGKTFLLRCVNSAALPMVRCYSIRHPRRVAIAE